MKTIFSLIFLMLCAPIFCKNAVFYEALRAVESSGRVEAVGDGGKAVGLYQIHPEYVEDVNRISGKKYKLEDRCDPEKSLEMVKIYLSHYCKRYERLTGKRATFQVAARIHNGGPNGWKKPATLKYWKKIQQEINNRRSSK